MIRCSFTASAHAPAALFLALYLPPAPSSFHISLSFQSFRHGIIPVGRLRNLADCNFLCLRIRGKLVFLLFPFLLHYLFEPLSVFSLPVPTLNEAFWRP